MAPFVIAGLGNPGTAYADTRHNAGFRVIDALAARAGITAFQTDARFAGAAAKITIAGDCGWLVKPLTFMNDSGRCIGPLCRFFKVPCENLIVVYDDITLAPGTAKISTGGSDGGHNGITSLLAHVPNAFVRFRIGIGPKRIPGQDLADHVLGRLTPEEQTICTEKLPFYIQGLDTLVTKGLVAAQNLINKKTSQQ